jgi:AraC-like DNA-binding protein
MLYFEPGIVQDAVGQITEGRTTDAEFAAPVLRRPGLARDFQELFSILTATDPSPAMMRADELLLLLLDASTVTRRDLPYMRGAPQSIRHALRLIDDAPAQPLTLEDLAREGGLSRFQVLRAFAKATGLTPHAYLVQRRTQLARRLIMQGVPLAQAALDSGFADQSHMTRVFVRQYGVSPTMYAKLAG